MADNLLTLRNVLASINDYALVDQTLSGGFALSHFRISVDRIFDSVVPLDEVNPVLFDRDIHRTTIDFIITRVHDSIEDSEKYIADIDALIPSSGDVKFTTTYNPFSSVPGGKVRFLIHGELITHQLLEENGKTTTHAFHIVGGRIHTGAHYFRLLEDGAFRLLEDGGRRELERD